MTTHGGSVVFRAWFLVLANAASLHDPQLPFNARLSEHGSEYFNRGAQILMAGLGRKPEDRDTGVL
jgi:hypothetical protein